MLGGDHSLSLPTLQALAERYGPDGYSVVHLDTHADTGAEIHGNTNNHGTPFYLARRGGRMRGANIVQIGLRGAWPFPDEFQWMRDQGFRWHTMDEIDERGLAAVARGRDRARARARAPRTYLTVDIDVLDPAFAPGTGTPEPGGLTTRELLRAVRRVAAELDLCAGTSSRCARRSTTAGITALAGRADAIDILTGMAARRSGTTLG